MINLEQYIDLTTLMVLATQDENGNPYTSNVYFGHDPETYKFYFISRLTREHSQHILNHENVAWSVVNSEQTASSGSNKRGLQFQ
jgi:uncharacterized protein YhbP (UPF0306 family)